MNNEKVWYAVHTRQRWEKKVAHTMEKKTIEHYCPLNKVYRQWSDRKKLVLEPLFISYVFIRITEAEIAKVKEVDGVINIVYWMGKPAIIKDAEIETIKQFLHDYPTVQLEREKVNANDTVRVVQGPLQNMEGSVVEVMNHYVKLLLPSLGYSMTALVSSEYIQKIFTESDKGDFKKNRSA